MANELTVSATIVDNLTGETFSVSGLSVNQGASPPRSVQDNNFVVTTAELAIPLGPLAGAVLGYAIFKNLDPINFVEIRTGTGATKIIRLKPGEIAVFRFGQGITAPYAIADTASCAIRFKIWES